MSNTNVRRLGPLSRLLPRDITTFRGPAWTAGALAVVNAAGTARSVIHIAAPDSGAQSIASMDTKVAGGGNIVSLLAQWGGAQLLEAGVIWIVLWRYRGLVPLMLGVVTAEQLLRVGIGTAKPLTTAHKPPGALSRVLLPAAAVTFAISLAGGDEPGAADQALPAYIADEPVPILQLAQPGQQLRAALGGVLRELLALQDVQDSKAGRGGDG